MADSLTMMVRGAAAVYRERACVSMCLPTHGVRDSIAGTESSSERRGRKVRGANATLVRQSQPFIVMGPYY